MSTKVAIVYEDHTNDRYIIEPVVVAALKSAGVSNPRVASVTNPRMTGFSSLLENLCAVVKRYRKTVAAIVIAFDLDGEDGEQGRRDKLARVRSRLGGCDLDDAATNVVLLGCRMEAEVYAIWGSRADIPASWSDVRAERDPKERYFDSLLTKRDELAVDGGRARLMRASLASGWNSLRGACGELQALEQDLRNIVRGEP